MTNPILHTKHKSTLRNWIVFNLVLLAFYLAFFHICLTILWPLSLVVGLLIAAIVALLCFRFHHLFLNRFEFLFYLALPLDIALESLIPLHQGYSFYLCAAAFWLVFLTYRIYQVILERAKGAKTEAAV